MNTFASILNLSLSIDCFLFPSILPFCSHSFFPKELKIQYPVFISTDKRLDKVFKENIKKN